MAGHLSSNLVDNNSSSQRISKLLGNSGKTAQMANAKRF
jgi:hypothetical protein